MAEGNNMNNTSGAISDNGAITDGDNNNSNNSRKENNNNNSSRDGKDGSDRSSKGKKNERELSKGRAGMIVTEAVAGTRDFLPPLMREREWLFDHFKEVARLFGFEPYDAPILEPEELYKRKAGEEITQQMYNFVDKSKLPVALRPEMTPTLARLILQQGKSLLMPVKWFSIPQCWRYETTTRGRKREHYQWNCDIWGIDKVTAEAELLAVMTTFFRRVGLTQEDVGIKVSSRRMLQSMMSNLGIKDKDFAATCVIIDKLDKLEEFQVLEELQALGIGERVARDVIDCVKVKSIEELAQKLGGEKHPAVEDLRTLWELAKGYGYEDWLIFDASIVRGLSYYTGIVFEVFARQGELQRAICGGGRYDKILSTYGAKQDIPACGFGFGDVVIMEILHEKGLVPKGTSEHTVDEIVIPFNEDLRGAACRVAMMLRNAGRSVDIFLKRARTMKQAFSYADRVGARRAVLIAPDEWGKGMVRVKYLRDDTTKAEPCADATAKEFDVPLDQLLTFERPSTD